MQRMDSYLEYTKGFNAGLVQMFSQYGFSTGVVPVQLPPVPVFSRLSDDLSDDVNTTHSR